MKRIWPSLISVRRLKVSRQRLGTRNGSTPSITSISAIAVMSVLLTPLPGARAPASDSLALAPAPRYFPALPPDLRYLKKSELGSSTSTSFLFLKLCLYASMLR